MRFKLFMPKISKVIAREILDSRGNPTIEVDLFLDNIIKARAAVPSGASTGKHEAVELRDGDSKRFMGKGCQKAVNNIVDVISKKVVGFDILDQGKFDQLLLSLDGTPNKSKLGANAILGVSLAYAKASAVAAGIPLYQYIAKLIGNKNLTLPVPMMNILNGGAHADNNVDIQEFMIMPLEFDRFSEALRAGVEIFHALKKVLKGRKLNTSVGDEGGFAPNLESNKEAIEVILEAVNKAGYVAGDQIGLALDAAASEFYHGKKYVLENEKKDSGSLVKFYENLVKKYPIYSIEDGLSEDDWDGWKIMTDKLGKKIQIVGDDLFVTNTERLKQGFEKGVANSILIKVNQIGTLTETLQAILMAQKNGYATVISHRSGETEDTTISDIAVGTGAGQIKTGSLCRTDRICKYNQLLRIEEELGNNAVYPGRDIFRF